MTNEARQIDLTTFRVLCYLLDNEEWWPTYEILADEIKSTVPKCKVAMQELKADGLAYYGPTIDDDGVPSGSGWFPTGKARGLKLTNGDTT